MKRKMFGVIGAGRFGESLAIALSEMGHDVLIVDSNEKIIQELADKVTHAVQADSTNEQILKTLGMKNFDKVVVAIGDLEASILTCLILREQGVQHVIAKARTSLHGKLLEKIGVDRVVFPERDMGIRLAKNLLASSILDYINLSPDYSVTELLAQPFMVGVSLGDLALRAKYGVNVIAIRSGGKINISPMATDVIKENDLLVIIGDNKAMEKLIKE